MAEKQAKDINYLQIYKPKSLKRYLTSLMLREI